MDNQCNTCIFNKLCNGRMKLPHCHGDDYVEDVNLEVKAMATTRDEQETTMRYDAVDRKWIVFSSVPKHMRKLLKIADVIKDKQVNGMGKVTSVTVELNESQIRMAKLMPTESILG